MASRAPHKVATFEDLDPSDRALAIIGTWEWDLGDGRLTYNAGAAALLAGDAALAGRPLTFDQAVACIEPEDLRWVEAYTHHSKKTGGPFTCEYRVRGLDGRVRWILSRGRIGADAQGRPDRGQGVLFDVTEAREASDSFLDGVEDVTLHPLERAADQCIAARRALVEAGNTALCEILDITLFEIGRELARMQVADRRRSMN